MDEEQLTSYRSVLCSKWVDIILLSEEYRQNIITNNPNPHKTSEYVSKLTRFWLELKPYVNHQAKGISAEFKAVYNSFDKYNSNPTALFSSNADDIPKLEAVLREAVYELGLSDIGLIGV